MVPARPGYGYGYRPGYTEPAPVYRSGYDHDRYERERYEREHSHHSDDRSYYGGSAAWYQAGEGLGKRDRREHRSNDYRRHKSQYDGRTEREFARGYNDGWHRG